MTIDEKVKKKFEVELIKYTDNLRTGNLKYTIKAVNYKEAGNWGKEQAEKLKIDNTRYSVILKQLN